MEDYYTIQTPDHHSLLFGELHILQKQGVLCDVILSAEDGEVMAHKVVLMAASKYFREKLSPTVCTPPSRIFLKGISVVELANLVKYIYTGKLLVAKETMDVTLEVSEILELNGVIKGYKEIITYEQMKGGTTTDTIQQIEAVKSEKATEILRGESEPVSQTEVPEKTLNAENAVTDDEDNDENLEFQTVTQVHEVQEDGSTICYTVETPITTTPDALYTTSSNAIAATNTLNTTADYTFEVNPYDEQYMEVSAGSTQATAIRGMPRLQKMVLPSASSEQEHQDLLAVAIASLKDSTPYGINHNQLAENMVTGMENQETSIGSNIVSDGQQSTSITGAIAATRIISTKDVISGVSSPPHVKQEVAEEQVENGLIVETLPIYTNVATENIDGKTTEVYSVSLDMDKVKKPLIIPQEKQPVQKPPPKKRNRRGRPASAPIEIPIEAIQNYFQGNPNPNSTRRGGPSVRRISPRRKSPSKSLFALESLMYHKTEEKDSSAKSPKVTLKAPISRNTKSTKAVEQYKELLTSTPKKNALSTTSEVEVAVSTIEIPEISDASTYSTLEVAESEVLSVSTSTSEIPTPVPAPPAFIVVSPGIKTSATKEPEPSSIQQILKSPAKALKEVTVDDKKEQSLKMQDFGQSIDFESDDDYEVVHAESEEVPLKASRTIRPFVKRVTRTVKTTQGSNETATATFNELNDSKIDERKNTESSPNAIKTDKKDNRTGNAAKITAKTEKLEGFESTDKVSDKVTKVNIDSGKKKTKPIKGKTTIVETKTDDEKLKAIDSKGATCIIENEEKPENSETVDKDTINDLSDNKHGLENQEKSSCENTVDCKVKIPVKTSEKISDTCTGNTECVEGAVHVTIADNDKRSKVKPRAKNSDKSRNKAKYKYSSECHDVIAEDNADIVHEATKGTKKENPLLNKGKKENVEVKTGDKKVLLVESKENIITPASRKRKTRSGRYTDVAINGEANNISKKKTKTKKDTKSIGTKRKMPSRVENCINIEGHEGNMEMKQQVDVFDTPANKSKMGTQEIVNSSEKFDNSKIRSSASKRKGKIPRRLPLSPDEQTNRKQSQITVNIPMVRTRRSSTRSISESKSTQSATLQVVSLNDTIDSTKDESDAETVIFSDKSFHELDVTTENDAMETESSSKIEIPAVSSFTNDKMGHADDIGYSVVREPVQYPKVVLKKHTNEEIIQLTRNIAAASSTKTMRRGIHIEIEDEEKTTIKEFDVSVTKQLGTSKNTEVNKTLMGRQKSLPKGENNKKKKSTDVTPSLRSGKRKLESSNVKAISKKRKYTPTRGSKSDHQSLNANTETVLITTNNTFTDTREEKEESKTPNVTPIKKGKIEKDNIFDIISQRISPRKVAIQVPDDMKAMKDKYTHNNIHVVSKDTNDTKIISPVKKLCEEPKKIQTAVVDVKEVEHINSTLSVDNSSKTLKKSIDVDTVKFCETVAQKPTVIEVTVKINDENSKKDHNEVNSEMPLKVNGKLSTGSETIESPKKLAANDSQKAVSPEKSKSPTKRIVTPGPEDDDASTEATDVRESDDDDDDMEGYTEYSLDELCEDSEEVTSAVATTSEVENTETNRTDSSIVKGSSMEGTFECPEEDCDFRTAEPASLSVHLKDKHYAVTDPKASTSLTCACCDILFRSRAALKQHEKRKRQKALTCDLCSKTFHKLNELHKHRFELHAIPMPETYTRYQCPHCDFVSWSQAAVDNHMVCHDETTLPGKQDEYRAVTSDAVTKHLAMKHDETPQVVYECELCFYKSRYKEHLHKHTQNVHGGNILAQPAVVEAGADVKDQPPSKNDGSPGQVKNKPSGKISGNVANRKQPRLLHGKFSAVMRSQGMTSPSRRTARPKSKEEMIKSYQEEMMEKHEKWLKKPAKTYSFMSKTLKQVINQPSFPQSSPRLRAARASKLYKGAHLHEPGIQETPHSVVQNVDNEIEVANGEGEIMRTGFHNENDSYHFTTEHPQSIGIQESIVSTTQGVGDIAMDEISTTDEQLVVIEPREDEMHSGDFVHPMMDNRGHADETTQSLNALTAFLRVGQEDIEIQNM